VNYGWHTSSGNKAAVTAAGQRVIQRPAVGHSANYTDYSQVVRLVRRDVEVCGPSGCEVYDIADVATSPALAPLVSHEGPLPDVRHPLLSGSVLPPQYEPGVEAPTAIKTNLLKFAAFAAAAAAGFYVANYWITKS
jgi:hypothetical protein